MRKKRLLWQIYPYYLIIALISMAAMTWYDCSALQSFYLDRTHDDLHDRAMLLEELFTKELTAGNFDRIDAISKELGRKTDTRITVILPDGKVVGDTLESPSRMDNH